MLACSWLVEEPRLPDPERARSEVAALFVNETFMDSIQRATGDRARTLKRIRETVAALERAGATILAPFDLSK